MGGTSASFFLPPLSLPLCLTSFIQSGTGGLHSRRARLSRTTAERCCGSLRQGRLPSFLLKAAVLREAKKTTTKTDASLSRGLIMGLKSTLDKKEK